MHEDPQTGEDPIRPGQESKLEPGLYVVATPIGNLRDITLRALDTLRSCDLIFCEDTRISRKLLSHYEIHKALRAFHDHSNQAVIDDIVERLKAGDAIAVISDAGTPLVSDPGFPLVRRVREEQIPIFVVPGPSALTAALSVAGLPTDRIAFAGFLPPKQKARTAEIAKLSGFPGTLVFYEAPHRIRRSLTDLAAGLGPRAAVVCRELTKKFEEYRDGTLETLAEQMGDKAKGEFVILIAPPQKAAVSQEELKAELSGLLETASVRDAASQAAQRLGVPRREAYELALRLKKAEN